MRRQVLGFGGLLGLAVASGWAGFDPELAEALPALAKVAARSKASAEEGYEVLTRSHGWDPRPWLGLAKVRLELGSAWSAQSALAQAARISSRAYFPEVVRTAREGKLAVPEEPAEVVDLAPFRERAAREVCFLRRLDPGPGATCPTRKTAFVAGTGGAWDCAFHPGEAPGIDPYRISGEVLSKALAAGDAWLRAQALRRADPSLLDDRVLARLGSEQDGEVRAAALARILNGLPDGSPGRAALRLARGFASDESSGVRRLAWTLAYAAGEAPRLGREDFETLVAVADDGLAPAYLVRAVYRGEPASHLGTLRRMLRTPGGAAKPMVIELLAREAGTEGARALAENLDRLGSAGFEAYAVGALQRATGLAIGRDGPAWRAALRKGGN